MPIKPKDLNPGFLKGIEDRYGKIDMEKDFFFDDLSTYMKFDPTYKSEGGGRNHIPINLPSFIELFSNLEDARYSAKTLKSNKDLRNDKAFQDQADNIIDTFNSFRTFFRKNYPDQYAMAKRTIRETMGMAYNTPYAFGKTNISPYTKAGYKLVDRKSLRKKSKGFDYIDLYK